MARSALAQPRSAVGLLLVAALLLALLAGTAAASPADIAAQRAEVTRIQSELDGIDGRLGAAAEAYNGARHRLGEAEARMDDNRRRIVRAERALTTARGTLAERLRRLYATPEPTLVDVLVQSGGIAEASERLQLLERVGQQDADLVGRVRASRARLAAARVRLAEDQHAARREVARAQEERRRVAGLLAERRAVLAQAQGDLRRMLEEQRERERREAERQRRLAEARAQQERAAAREASRPSPQVAPPSAPQPRGGASPQRQRPEPQAAPPAPPASPAAPPAPREPERAQARPRPAPAPAPTTRSAPPAPPSGSGNARVVDIAKRYLGVPYRWGGRSPSGFDCSGLASYVYEQIGKSVPHFTGAIWARFPRVSRGQEQPGDLVFFRADLGHMGIYIGGGQYIHAPRTGDVVKISSLSGRSDYRGAVRP